MMDIKICGVKDPRTAELATRLGATHVGIVIDTPGSPREVDPRVAGHVIDEARDAVMCVLVTRVLTRSFIDHVESLEPGAVQFHDIDGDGMLDSLRAVHGGAVIHGVAPSITGPGIDLLAARVKPGDRLLVDGSTGTGTMLDIEATGRLVSFLGVRAGMPRSSIMVAGGLTPGNVGDVITRLGPGGVDTSSGVESAPGIKDHDKIKAFIFACKKTTEGRAS